MTLIQIVILAFALALDAMLVSFSYGLIISDKRLKNSIIMACSFGFFQFIMPLIGWILTGCIYFYINIYSKWIVFLVFLFLCFKFVYEVFSDENSIDTSCISLICLLGLSVATSIDALGAGISIKMLSSDIFIPSIIIGIVTFILSLFGFNFANILKNVNKKIVYFISAGLFLYLAISSVL
ncbi:manganese efflux pump [bacterium]|nr:manganese efflux pump [bacterium]